MKTIFISHYMKKTRHFETILLYLKNENLFLVLRTPCTSGCIHNCLEKGTMGQQELQRQISGCSRLFPELNTDYTYTCISMWIYEINCVNSFTLIVRSSKDIIDILKRFGPLRCLETFYEYHKILNLWNLLSRPYWIYLQYLV